MVVADSTLAMPPPSPLPPPPPWAWFWSIKQPLTVTTLAFKVPKSEEL